MTVYVNDSGNIEDKQYVSGLSMGSTTIDGDNLSTNPGGSTAPVNAVQWNQMFSYSNPFDWDFTNVWRWDSSLQRPVLRNVGPGANRAPGLHN